MDRTLRDREDPRGPNGTPPPETAARSEPAVPVGTPQGDPVGSPRGDGRREVTVLREGGGAPEVSFRRRSGSRAKNAEVAWGTWSPRG